MITDGEAPRDLSRLVVPLFGSLEATVSEHDLRWAVSVVARLIMYRWYRSAYATDDET